MRKLLFILSCLFCFSTIQSQNTKNDDLLFGAMQAEMNRSIKGLKMPNTAAPFFISFIAAEGETINITTSLGAIISSNHKPLVRSAWARVLTESYKQTNDIRHNNQGIQSVLTIDNDENQIRRNFWSLADEDYKKGLEFLALKKNVLRKINLTPEEEAIFDYMEAEPIELIRHPEHLTPFDKGQLETLCKELSNVFKYYPKLYASSIQLIANQGVYYNINSEGSKTKQPLSFVVIKISAKVRSDDGAVLSDFAEICASDIATLPSTEDLLSSVHDFAKNLQNVGKVEAVSEYYSGPVLFEADAVADIFTENLLSSGGLVSYRKPTTATPSTAPRNKPIGRKLIDSRLTVTNHIQLTEYENHSLVGAYAVDGEAIIPDATQVLVENGLLKQFLNNRIPNEFNSKSNGNNRIGANPAFITTDIKPAVLDIKTNEGLDASGMRKRLLEIAKEEGLEHAFIVRKLTGVIQIYKIDVETEEEILMRMPEIEKIGINRLKRIDAISSEEFIENRLYTSNYNQDSRGEAYPISIICPNSIILQDVEINKMSGGLEIMPTVKNPLER